MTDGSTPRLEGKSGNTTSGVMAGSRSPHPSSGDGPTFNLRRFGVNLCSDATTGLL